MLFDPHQTTYQSRLGVQLRTSHFNTHVPYWKAVRRVLLLDDSILPTIGYLYTSPWFKYINKELYSLTRLRDHKHLWMVIAIVIALCSWSSQQGFKDKKTKIPKRYAIMAHRKCLRLFMMLDFWKCTFAPIYFSIPQWLNQYKPSVDIIETLHSSATKSLGTLSLQPPKMISKSKPRLWLFPHNFRAHIASLLPIPSLQYFFDKKNVYLCPFLDPHLTVRLKHRYLIKCPLPI